MAFCGGRGASGCHRGGRQGARGAARAAMGGLFAVVGEERFWLFAERRSLDGRISVAGLNRDNVAYVAAAIHAVSK